MRTAILIFLILLTVLQVLIAAESRGQDIRVDRVTVGLQGETLANGLKQIEQQTSLRFFYRNTDIEMLNRINLPAGTRTIEQTLNELLQNTFLSFRQMERNILLVRQPQKDFEIRGHLVNSAHQPVPAATVQILNTDRQQTVQTTQADLQGNFRLNVQHSGEYIIKISAVGYDSLSASITLKEIKLIQLPDYQLNTSKNQLKEVVITGSKPLIKQEIDKITYDVQRDPESLTSSVLDMMRKVPMLSVDGEDNIRLQGGSHYQIMIDGKPSSLLLRSPKDVLKYMSATNILSIEVITTPPAKYDSEGLAGIINLITKKKQANGYSGSINVAEKAPVGGPTLSLSYAFKKDKFSASGFGGTGYFNQPDIHYTRNRQTSGVNATNLIQNGIRANHNWFSYLDTEYSFELDSLNLITAEIGYNKGINHSTDNQGSLLNDVAQGTLLRRYTISNSTKNQWNGIDLGLNYQLGFKSSKSRLLTFSYKYRQTNNEDSSQIVAINRFNYNSPDFDQVNNSGSHEQTAQIDYAFSIKKVKTELGVKGIFRNNSSDFRYQTLPNASLSPVIDTLRSNSFDNYQNVYSAYNSYTYNLGTFGFKAGYRLEKTFVSQTIRSSEIQYGTHYTNLVPSLSVNYNFKNMSNLNFGFTQRIQRPNIWVLNPYIDRSNPNFEIQGNPDLAPVKSNNFQLRYSPSAKGSFILGAFYSFANNTIQEISTFDPLRQITSVTYANLGKDKGLGITLNINHPLGTKGSFNANGNLRYVWYEGMINNVLTNNSGIIGTTYAGASYKLTKGLNINANISFYSANISLQTRTNAYASATLGMNKELIKSKLIFSAALSNPFTKYRDSKSSTTGNNFVQYDYAGIYFRSVTFSLNYRFGKLAEKVKKTKAGIDNDDAVNLPGKNQ